MHYCEDNTYEIKPIPIGNYEVFKQFAINQQESWKRILQHVYTYDPIDGKKLYDMIKEATILCEKKGVDAFNGLKLYNKFMSEFYRLKQIHTTVTAPNFGACEYCLRDLEQFPRVKKHKKFFKNADPKMWDFFSKNSESK